MTGKFRKKTGKIISVDTKRSRIAVEGVTVKKQDGSKENVKFHPSNLQITELNTEDKKRMKTSKESKEETVKETKHIREEKK